MCTGASLAVAAVLAAPPAHAELRGSEWPCRPFVAATKTWEHEEGGEHAPAQPPRSEPAPNLGIVTLPPILVSSNGASEQGSFRWSPRPGLPLLATEREGLSLCLGATCAGPRTLGVGFDPRSPGAIASARVIAGLGPMGVAALALFASPVPKKTSPFALAFSLIFACGGGGLAMRGGWH